jgi:hypothetical protein
MYRGSLRGDPGRLSGVDVVVDQAGEEGDQVGALLGGERGETAGASPGSRPPRCGGRARRSVLRSPTESVAVSAGGLGIVVEYAPIP